MISGSRKFIFNMPLILLVHSIQQHFVNRCRRERVNNPQPTRWNQLHQLNPMKWSTMPVPKIAELVFLHGEQSIAVAEIKFTFHLVEALQLFC